MNLLYVFTLLLTAVAAAQPLAPTAPQASGTPPHIFSIARVQGPTDFPYTIIFPPSYKPSQAWPALIVLGGGVEDKAGVEAALTGTWEKEAAARGWVLIGLAAPNATRLTQTRPESLNGFLDEIIRTFTIEGGKFYIAGAAEGGTAALYLASLVPERFRSVIVTPGMAEDWFMGQAERGLRDVPTTFLIGDMDEPYMRGTEKTIAQVQNAGANHCYEVRFAGRARDLGASPSDLFSILESTAKGGPPLMAPPPPPVADPAAGEVAAQLAAITACERTLDQLHAMAAAADEGRYFALYAPNAVFLGTDATERWTLEEFKAFAHPYFAKGKAWTYTPVKGQRHVVIEHEGVAWFDEQLDNAKLGRCRGSGVLVKVGGEWRVRQYNLTMLIPNEVAEKAAQLSK